MAAKWWRSGAGTGLRALASSSELSKPASFHTIQAIPRELTGSRTAARDRAQGRIPAVVFNQAVLEKNHGDRGSDSHKRIVTTEKKQIQAILKSVTLPFFCSTRFPLQIRVGSGSSVLLESGNVLPIKFIETKRRNIMNLVFGWANEGTKLKVDVPVVFKGEDVCPGLKKGGHLNRIRTSIKYLCPAELIPPTIEVDVSNLDIGDRIFTRDVEVNQSLKLLSKNEEIPICCGIGEKSYNVNAHKNFIVKNSLAMLSKVQGEMG